MKYKNNAAFILIMQSYQLLIANVVTINEKVYTAHNTEIQEVHKLENRPFFNMQKDFVYAGGYVACIK